MTPLRRAANARRLADEAAAPASPKPARGARPPSPKPAVKVSKRKAKKA